MRSSWSSNGLKTPVIFLLVSLFWWGLGWSQPDVVTEHSLHFGGVQQFFVVEPQSFPRLLTFVASTKEEHAIALGIAERRDDGQSKLIFQKKERNSVRIERLFVPAQNLLTLVYALDREGDVTLEVHEEKLSMLESGAELQADMSGVLKLESKSTSVGWRAAANSWYTLCVAQAPGISFSAQLKGRKLWETYQADATGSICLPNLAPGDLALELILAQPKVESVTQYAYIHLEQQRDPSEAFVLEEEPHDTSWDLSLPVRGVLHDGADRDTFSFAVNEDSPEAGLKLEITPEEAYLRYSIQIMRTDSRQKLFVKSGHGSQTTDWLYLPKGTYAVSLHGAESRLQYSLRATVSQRGMVKNEEVEPNDTKQFANALTEANLIKGVLRDLDDTDVFRFDTTSRQSAQRWLVQLAGQGVVSLQIDKRTIRKAAGQDSLRVHGTYLLPGLHYLTVRGAGSYSIFARALGPQRPGIEREPNDPHTGVAQSVVFDEPLIGSFDGINDVDLYRFSVPSKQNVLWRVKAPLDTEVDAVLYWSNERLKKEQIPAGAVLEQNISLEAGDYSVHLSNRKISQDEYSLEVGRPSPSGQLASSKFELGGSLDDLEVRSFSRFGQILTATLSLRSLVETPLNLELALDSPDQIVRSDLPTVIKLDKGEAIKKRVKIEFPPDVRDGEGVLTLQAKVDNESHSIPMRFKAGESAELRRPFTWFAVPSSLRGAIDVARSSFGATIQGAAEGSVIYQIINGIAPYWSAYTLRNSDFKNGVQINLDKTYQVHGFYFNTSTRENNSSRLQVYELYYSRGQGDWRLAVKGTLATSNENQYVALPEAVEADRILLKPISNFTSGKRTEQATIQEFGVLAFPDESFDIGRNESGAHVVYHTFQEVWGGERKVHLIDGIAPVELRCTSPKGQAKVSWVVGLHNNRAARIDSVKYILPKDTKSRLPVPYLLYSVDGPFGPWTPAPEPVLIQQRVEWTFQEAVYARFLKFESKVIPKAVYSCSMDLQIAEQGASESYRSILGEWGGFSDEGPFEYYQSEDRVTEFSVAGGASMEEAVPLGTGLVESSVKLERNVDWYKFVAPEGQNVFTAQLEKSASTRLSVDLYEQNSESPEPVLADVQETSEREGHGWNLQQTSWSIKRGVPYTLRVAEAARNIVVTWDQSGSVSKSRDYIESALHDWSQRLQQDKEMVQLFPFVDAPLTDGWAGYPFLVQAALAKETQSYSSDAEKALVQANELLGEVAGARSIIVTTDADGPVAGNLWSLLQRVCPRVFVGALSASGSVSGAKEKALADIMQDWTSVCGGEYRDIKGFEHLESLFQVAAARLRSPKSYRLRGHFEQREPPKPGRLIVSFASKSARALNPHLSIVLDTSGSMLQRIRGVQRIEIARRAMREMAKGLPEQLGVSLFTFGETENSCSVVRKLSEHNSSRAKFLQAINSTKAVNNVKTPLAEALLALEDRLADRKGGETVVLLTDGEETCGGDPAAAIARLRSRGVAVQVEIVGFAIDDSKLKETFREWAKLGAGHYWDAKDEADLTTYLRVAVSPEIVVSDSAGRVVFQGAYERPLLLQPGGYKVRAGKERTGVVQDVEVKPGRDTAIRF